MLVAHENQLNSLIKQAIARVLADDARVDNVAASVLAALDEYEDAALLSILKNESEDTPVDLSIVQSALKS